MVTPEIQENIESLLSKNLFLKQEIKEQIKGSLNTLSEGALGDLQKKLEESAKNQKIVLYALVKENPDILAQIKNRIRIKKIDEQRTKESNREGEDFAQIEDLEEQINNL